MSHRNHRSMPHPVLSKQRQDYTPECWFRVTTPHTMLASGGKEIAITVKYDLASATLADLIAEQKANYVSVIECSRTYRRERQMSPSDEDIILLKRHEWQGTITMTPYVAATADIAGFTATELSPLVKALAPDGADLPAGAILAIGDITEIELDANTNVESIFDLAADRRLAKGQFAVDITGERIAISLHPSALALVNAARNQTRHEPVLHQALYLHALEKAVRNLPEYADKRWAAVIQRKLDENDIYVDDDELSENAERYAQTIFESPLERMLQALQRENSHE